MQSKQVKNYLRAGRSGEVIAVAFMVAITASIIAEEYLKRTDG